MIGDYANKTVVLRSLMENEETNSLLNKALSTYPLYKGKKDYDLIPTREALNEKILNHYKYREIGFETMGRFLDELKIAMSEIMPYYNELFKTVETMADLPSPFDNVDVTETYEETRTHTTETEGQTTGSSSTTTDASATSKVEGTGTTTADTTTTGSSDIDKSRKFSDTPQNSVSNLNNYLTEYTEENESRTNSNTEKATESSTSKTEGTDTSNSTTEGTDTASTTGKSEGTETTKHTYTKKGNQGVNTYAHDMNEFRTSIFDVVDRIIHDNRLAELFMLVW